MASAGDTVNEIIQNAIDGADDMVQATDNLAKFAVQAASDIAVRERVNPEIHTLERERIPEVDMVDPGVFATTFQRPNTSLELPQFRDPANVTVPDLPQAPPALNTDDLFLTPRPVFDVPNLVGELPDIDTDFVFPDAPLISLPDAPEPIALSLPEVRDPALPSFEAVFQGVAPTAPDAADRLRVEYDQLAPVMRNVVDSAIDTLLARYNPEQTPAMAALEARIAERMGGGTAYSDEWEQALYDRARSRIHAEVRAATEEAAAAAGRRGFALPQATIASLLERVRTAASDRLATSATEVAIERHRLELGFYQFILQLSQSMRQMMLSAMLQHAANMVGVNGQAIEMARATAGLLVDLHNAAIQLFQAQTQQYRVEADIFEARLRAALADLEKAKVQLDIERTKVDINRVAVDTYQSRIAAQSELVRQYVAQLDGIRTRAEVQRQKVDIFGETVRAHLGMVQAKEAEFGAYRAAIDGDSARVNAFAQQVAAYRAQVDAQTAITAAQTSANEAISQYNQAQQQRYAATVEQVRTELQASVAEFSANADAYVRRLEQFKTAASLRETNARLSIEEFRATTDASTRIFEGLLRQATSNNNISVEQIRMLADSARSSAAVLGGVASTYVSSLNTMASIAEEQFIQASTTP